MSVVLEVEGLVKHFPIAGQRSVVQAVNGVGFTVARGETLALVGESGSGKTTVGRCVLGLIQRTAGVVRFHGAVIDKQHNIRSRDLLGKLQLVFQEPAESLDPRMRIGETIGEPLRSLGTPRADREKRVREVARRVSLGEVTLDQFPGELSAGQQQRVGIARAIVTDPELIVLDEPTSALDPTARAEIIDLLIRLQKELETAYLFISHDLSTVRYVSHRVAVMYLGMIVEQGTAAEIFAHPRHPYSVGLLSSVLLPNPKLKREVTVDLKGEIPSPIDLPTGCYLAGRCPFADDQCRAAMPPADQVGEGHVVHCYHFRDALRGHEALDYFEDFQAEAEFVLGAGRR
ncbi:MAG: oligopeptide/dipeptide ABC transporter ATP-binding protein [Alphaproteobacteria bacterium]